MAATGLPAARLASSEDVALGAPVFVIAATGPTERRVAGGLVTDLGEFEAYWEYVLDRGIVSSAANPGFGGGPLFDLRGSVVGVVSLNLEGIGRESLAIPVEYFTRHRAELLRFGRVTSRRRRAWIGVFPHALEERLIVAGLVPDGPGERAGLQEGDVILRVDDEEVSSRRALYAALWRHEPGRAGAARGDARGPSPAGRGHDPGPVGLLRARAPRLGRPASRLSPLAARGRRHCPSPDTALASAAFLDRRGRLLLEAVGPETVPGRMGARNTTNVGGFISCLS